MVKPHASGPRMMRERRNKAEILNRADKQAERRTPKVHRDPPDPDPIDMDDPRIPDHTSGWEFQRARQPRRALGSCLIRLLLVAFMLAALALATAPRSAAVIPSPGFSGYREADQPQTSAPLGGGSASGLPPAAAPVPLPSGDLLGSARYSAVARWCAPTKTKCHGWGGQAKLGALNTFRFGDKPYTLRVWRGRRHVDVRIVSFCACANRADRIDLSPSAFARLAPLSRGVLRVEIEDLRGIKLPPTDTE